MSALLNEIGCGSQGANGALVIELPIWLRRRGSELKLVVGEQGRAPRRDRNLVGKLALGFLWLEELTRGAVLSIDAIARREKVSTKVVRRTMDLTTTPVVDKTDIVTGPVSCNPCA